VRPRRHGPWVPGPSTSPLAAMKHLTRFFAAFGVMSGFAFFAARIWYSHPHSPTPSQLLNHILTSAPIVVIHALNLAKLRSPTSRIPRLVLVVLNLFMVVLFASGVVYLRGTGCGPLKLSVFIVLWLVPFVVTALYFVGFASRASQVPMAANNRWRGP
jgi:hypothetical protein